APQSEDIELCRHGEDHVKVRHIEQLLLSRVEPRTPRLGLTPRAVPVPARAENRIIDSALLTPHLPQQPHRLGATPPHVRQRLPLLRRHSMCLEVLLPFPTYDLSDVSHTPRLPRCMQLSCL